jgi:hypothetical protein
MATQELNVLRRKTALSFTGEFLAPASRVELELFIPVAQKDWKALPMAIRAARRMLKHPIRTVYVVGPEKPPDWASFMHPSDVFLHDKEVTPVRRQDIDLRPGGKDRSGWILMQLIKLAAETVCRGEYILILDSDTLLLRPQRFVKSGRVVLNVADESHGPYYAQINRMLPGLPIAPFSFVTHHQLMQATVLKELKAEIEKGGKPWHKAILDTIDRNEQSGFSDYELYGNFMYHRHHEAVHLEHFLNVGLSPSRLDRLWFITCRHPLLKSASFHAR